MVKSIVIYDTRYELSENKILVQHEELVDYHKRDYDWVTGREIKFENPQDAQTIMNALHQAFRDGEKYNQRKSADKLKGLLQSIQGGFTDG